MQEFAIVSASSFDPAALASKLTEKSAEGWTIVSIVPTGGDITAFLSRAAGATDSAPAAEAAPAPQPEPAPAPVAAEPAGWAVAPEPAATPMAPIVDPTPAVSYQPAPAAQPAYQPAPAAQPAYQPAPAASPAVPAGWYADPAGRFELRYWDGGTWTEHVSRAGQQFTDAPVA